MKILALHGLGSSSQLLARQLAPLMRRLGSNFTFHFLDGRITCARGPGVSAWATGPFHSYVEGFSPSDMNDALEELDEYIKQHGPFDGVLGFSMGAAMAISYLLHQKEEYGLPPFSFGIFLSTIFIASPDDSYCKATFSRWLDDDHAAFRASFLNGNYLPFLQSTQERELAQYLHLVLSMKAMATDTVLPRTAADFLEAKNVDQVPRLVHPQLLRRRVKIPTVHVVGKGDAQSIQQQSQVGRELCATRNLRVYEHEGGHDIPFQESDVEEMCTLIIEIAEAGQCIRDLDGF